MFSELWEVQRYCCTAYAFVVAGFVVIHTVICFRWIAISSLTHQTQINYDTIVKYGCVRELSRGTVYLMFASRNLNNMTWEKTFVKCVKLTILVQQVQGCRCTAYVLVVVEFVVTHTVMF